MINRTDVLHGLARTAGGMSCSRRMLDRGIRALICAFVLASSVAVCEAETVTYYYTNPQGTPLATADAAGNVLSTADYRPYGAQVLGAPEARPGYTGHVSDPDSGFVYMQARYYDAIAGRFLSADPATVDPGSLPSFSRYAYADLNPVINVDPNGRDTRVWLGMYIINPALQVGHSFVAFEDLDSGRRFVARAGPSSDNYGVLSALTDTAAYERDSTAINDGPQGYKAVMLEANPVLYWEDSPDAQHEGMRAVNGTSTIVKGPTGDLVNKVLNFNRDVNSANIPYKAQSQNSNSYANTLYNDVTGQPAPASENSTLPGITHNLGSDFCLASLGCDQ